MQAYRPKRKNRKARRKPFFKKGIFWRLFLIILLLLSFVYFMFFSPIFRLKSFEIKGNINSEKCLKHINDFLENQEGKNIIFLKNDGIRQNILDQCPLLKEAGVRKKFPNKLVLFLRPRESAAIFCLSDSDKCFLADKDAFAFRLVSNREIEKEKESGEMALPLIILSSEKNSNDNLLGKELIAFSEINRILEINDWLEKKLGIEVQNFALSAAQKLTVETKESWQIYFDLSLSPRDINLSLFKLQVLLEKGITPKERKNLKYIDLRFSKAYYK